MFNTLLLLLLALLLICDFSYCARLKGNQLCKIKTGDAESRCINRYQCWHYQKSNKLILKNYEKSIRCKLPDNVVDVCCPPEWNSTTGAMPMGTIASTPNFIRAAQIVQNKCKNYSEYRTLFPHDSFRTTLDCPQSEPVIVGGKEAKPKELPHMALIGYIYPNHTKWSCGGSLISETFVLTAAHCDFDGKVRAELVLLGELTYASDTDDAKPEFYSIVERYIHPSFESPKMSNDIMLLKLNASVVFNNYIRPICLSTSSDSPTLGSEVTISGWGFVETIRKSGGALMKAEVHIFDNKRCAKAFQGHPFYPGGVNTNSILCAGNSDKIEDTCRGDSGGPLQVSSGPCLWTQLGVISVGSNICGDVEHPEGIYTRVAYFIEWIQEKVWPSSSI